MKKLVIVLFMLLVTSVAFAEVWKNSEKIIEDFWNKGTVVKVIKDENNITYLSKDFIQYITIDEDDFKLQCYPTQKSAIGLGSWSIPVDCT